MFRFECGTSLEGPHELFLVLFLGVVKLLEVGASLEEGGKCVCVGGVSLRGLAPWSL